MFNAIKKFFSDINEARIAVKAVEAREAAAKKPMAARMDMKVAAAKGANIFNVADYSTVDEADRVCWAYQISRDGGGKENKGARWGNEKPKANQGGKGAVKLNCYLGGVFSGSRFASAAAIGADRGWADRAPKLQTIAGVSLNGKLKIGGAKADVKVVANITEAIFDKIEEIVDLFPGDEPLQIVCRGVITNRFEKQEDSDHPLVKDGIARINKYKLGSTDKVDFEISAKLCQFMVVTKESPFWVTFREEQVVKGGAMLIGDIECDDDIVEAKRPEMTPDHLKALRDWKLNGMATNVVVVTPENDPEMPKSDGEAKADAALEADLMAELGAIDDETSED